MADSHRVLLLLFLIHIHYYYVHIVYVSIECVSSLTLCLIIEEKINK